MTKRFQIDDDGDISEFDSNGKWVDCWMYANGKHWEGLCNELNHLNDENEQLKKVLGAILLEVKRDISNTNQTGEIRLFINPNSFNLISEVLRKYGVLKEW